MLCAKAYQGLSMRLLGHSLFWDGLGVHFSFFFLTLFSRGAKSVQKAPFALHKNSTKLRKYLIDYKTRLLCNSDMQSL